MIAASPYKTRSKTAPPPQPAMASLNNTAGPPQQYCLKWNSFTSNMSEMFQTMLMHEHLVDCTLSCDDMSIKAHKLILSACSPYFKQIFMDNPCKHPIVILSNIKFNDLKAIIDFIYSGEVNIPTDQFNSLFDAAVALKIKGLSEFNERQNNEQAASQLMGQQSRPGNNIVPPSINPLLHSTPLANKVLTMQNPAATNNLAASLASQMNSYNQMNSFIQKSLKSRKRARTEAMPAQASLRNLNAIASATRNNPSTLSSLSKLNKHLINTFVKAVPTGNPRLEAARFIQNLAKEQAKNGSAVSAGGSSDDEDDVKDASVLESNNNQNMANKNGQFEGEDDFSSDPTKLLEQSMSTPENANLDYEGEDDDGNDVNGNEDGFSSNNSNQDVSHISGGSDPSVVQSNKTIEEYEQYLSEIQSKNLTTCPICSKEFIKKSKLIRHYHTHFSDYRPKFSCVFCGKLFTTQDWCKRHAASCVIKQYPNVSGSNLTELYGDMEKERDI